jgi:hypothetical protein
MPQMYNSDYHGDAMSYCLVDGTIGRSNTTHELSALTLIVALTQVPETSQPLFDNQSFHSNAIFILCILLANTTSNVPYDSVKRLREVPNILTVQPCHGNPTIRSQIHVRFLDQRLRLSRRDSSETGGTRQPIASAKMRHYSTKS